MNQSNLKVEINHIVEINSLDRWQVYQRLQELDIPCQCGSNQPLQVQIHNTKAAIQLWSVARRLIARRSQQIDWLHSCWQLKTYTKENYGKDITL